ncbi:hypothetical protein RSOLAG22IIIB_10190 [Rhizoctonia solani]|uniref:Uncharacterized protein n=1 Tax=Rhizoctonia solani TaxID=456999 RepID=A0A0K6G280_9AGAM|nr:hypothetical protein RSOLAG22IIIB_10190 [Rhizoctonia solani]
MFRKINTNPEHPKNLRSNFVFDSGHWDASKRIYPASVPTTTNLPERYTCSPLLLAIQAFPPALCWTLTLWQMPVSKPDEDPVRSQSTPTTTARSKKLAASTQQAPPPDELTPTEPHLSATKGKKSTRPKQLSAVAEEANKQAVAKQNAKESQGAKKAKNAEAAVFEETPDETAAFLAKAKGQSQPSKTSPNLTSLMRSRPLVVVTATEQMLAVVVAKPNSTNASHKNAANAFLHAHYALRSHLHLSTLTRLHHTHGGAILMDYLTRLHKQFRAAPSANKSTSEAAPSNRRPKVRTRSACSINLGGILNDPTLTSDQKVKLLNIIYDPAKDDGSPKNSSRTIQQYEGLLAGVNADSDDSEVEARRAGALPDTDSNSKAGVEVWIGESDEETINDEVEAEGEGNNNEGDDEDKSEAEIVDEEDPEAKETGGGRLVQPRTKRRFFNADGGLPSLAGSKSDGEANSDGEGASGTVATQVDGDQTMMTAVASDSEDD